MIKSKSKHKSQTARHSNSQIVRLEPGTLAMPTQAEPIACCGPLAMLPLISCVW
jgi:hypothetical protein